MRLHASGSTGLGIPTRPVRRDGGGGGGGSGQPEVDGSWHLARREVGCYRTGDAWSMGVADPETRSTRSSEVLPGCYQSGGSHGKRLLPNVIRAASACSSTTRSKCYTRCNWRSISSPSR